MTMPQELPIVGLLLLPLTTFWRGTQVQMPLFREARIDTEPQVLVNLQNQLNTS